MESKNLTSDRSICTLTAVSVFGGIFDYLIKGLSYQMQTEPKVSKCINKGMCK